MHGVAHYSVVTVTTEADMVARFVSGDPEAVRDLYRRYSRPMFSVALRSLGDRGLAEEAVQQSFLQAWRAAPRFDPTAASPRGSSPSPAGSPSTVPAGTSPQPPDPARDQLAELPPGLEATWTTWRVRRALDTMPPDERTVVEATHFLGLTHEEAAMTLGIPVGTVKSRSHRAHRRLAELLLHLQEASA